MWHVKHAYASVVGFEDLRGRRRVSRDMRRHVLLTQYRRRFLFFIQLVSQYLEKAKHATVGTLGLSKNEEMVMQTFSIFKMFFVLMRWSRAGKMNSLTVDFVCQNLFYLELLCIK